jgi:hypothetical protein
MNRIVVLAGAIACVASLVTAGPALAELPQHPLTASIGPSGQDFLETEFTDIGYGEAIAIRNEWAFVGIPRARDDGHVAVLNLTSTGWQRVATLLSPDPAETAFGESLTFRDGVLVVGGSHAAYVFKRSGSTFRHTQTLRPPAADSVGRFPVALRYEAGTLIASGFRSMAPSVVYVFQMNSTGAFVRRATLQASDGEPGDSFGRDLSMTDRMLLVGGPPAAYTFRRNSSGNWVQAQKLMPARPSATFGRSVAIDQDMILVGAPFEDVEGLPSGPPTPDAHVAGGAVYGFLPGAAGYVESFRLRPRPDERFEYEEFGSHIEMSGTRIAVVATGADPAVSILKEGLVFTYTRNGSSVLARGIATGALEITAMGLSNGTLLIGANVDDRCPFGCLGSAFFYNVNLFRQ